MLRIYEESKYRSQTRLKRWQVLALFVGGTLSGAWLAGPGQWSLLQDALAARSDVQGTAGKLTPIRAGTLRSCLAEETSSLRLDCQLSVPELSRSEGV